MSWGLYNHNAFYAFDGIEQPQLNELNQTAEFLYEQTGTNYDNRVGDVDLINGAGIAATPNGQTIIFIEEGIHLRVSRDRGDTWTEQTKPDSTPNATAVLYDAFKGNWVINFGKYNFREMNPYLSSDDAVTFSRVYPSPPYRMTYGWAIHGPDVQQPLAHIGRVFGTTPSAPGGGLYLFPDYEVASASLLLNTASLTVSSRQLKVLDGVVISRHADQDQWTVWSSGGFTNYSSPAPSASTWATSGTGYLYAIEGLSAPSQTAKLYRYDKDATDFGADTEFETFDFGEQVVYAWFNYANGIYFIAAYPFEGSDDTERMLIFASNSGDPGTFTQKYDIDFGSKVDPNYKRPNFAYIGNNEYVVQVILYRNGFNPRMCICKFSMGTSALVVTGIRSVVASQAPDIFYLMDDDVGSVVVEDIGSKGWANTISGSVSFGVDGLVSVGSAALFEGGNVPLTPSIPSSTSHAHLFILKHDGAAGVRTLLESDNAFSISINADDKIEYSSTESLVAPEALNANEKYLVLVIVRHDASGVGRVSIYIDGGRGGLSDIINIPVVSSTKQTLGAKVGGTVPANGVTIDYYAQIPYANLDINKILSAWAIEKPTVTVTPPETDYPDNAGLKCVARFDAVPTSLRKISKISGGYVSYLNYGNEIDGGGEVVSYAAAGSLRDLASARFGASSVAIPKKFGGIPPVAAPIWLGAHDFDLGTRDFTIQIFFKQAAGSSGYVDLLSSVAIHTQGEKHYLYSGFDVRVVGQANNAGMYIRIGRSLQHALTGSGMKYAGSVTFTGFPSYDPADWNFITISRRDSIWYATINGKTAANKSSSNPGAPILRSPNWEAMTLGSIFTIISRFTGVQRLTVSPAFPSGRWVYTAGEQARLGNVDEFVFILDKAYYLETFDPPTVPFNTQPGGASPTLSSPTGTQTGSTTADGTVNSDKASGTLWAVVTTSATPPSDIKAGTGAAYSTSQAVTATGTQNVAATGLTASTGYYWHYYQEDAASNGSGVQTSAQFTTAA